LPENLSNSLHRGEVGGVGLYLSAAYFLRTKQIGLGLATSIENTLAERAEKFGQVSHFSPALSIHQIPLFNTLSGYGSYIFPAIAPLIIHQTMFWACACWSQVIVIQVGERKKLNFGVYLLQC